MIKDDLKLSVNALKVLEERYLLKNEQGRVVLDVKITGPAKNPEFALDTSQPEEKFKQQMKEKAQEQTDKAKDQLKEKGQDLLKDLFKKKKK